MKFIKRLIVFPILIIALFMASVLWLFNIDDDQFHGLFIQPLVDWANQEEK